MQKQLCATVSFLFRLITPSMWTCFASALRVFFFFFSICTRAHGRCLGASSAPITTPSRCLYLPRTDRDSSTLPAAKVSLGRVEVAAEALEVEEKEGAGSGGERRAPR